jgi:4-amino-4-deoxy-L-arabinose transferase-like glycosyltransferase
LTKHVDTLQKNKFFSSPKLWQATLQLITTRRMLFLMMVLQWVWLAVIWFTGAANKVYKLPILGVYTFVTGISILAFPNHLNWSILQRFTKYLTDSRYVLGGLLIIILIGGTFYAANQRMWDFDEEGNYAAAELVAADGSLALFREYSEQGWLGKQHPPMGPLAYGLTVKLLGSGLFQARLLSLAFMVGTGVLTYLIGRDLYDSKTGLYAVLILFSFPLFFRLGTAAVVETPLTFFFSLTIYLTLCFVKQPGLLRAIPIGMAVVIGLLFKYTMVFIIPIIFCIIGVKISWQYAIRYFFVFVGIVLLGLAAWISFATESEIINTQIQTIWSYTVLVTTNPYGRKILFESITNRLPTAWGVYNMPLIVFAALLFWVRKNRQDLPILLWIGLVWIPLFLTLPEHRYFLSTFPAVAIVTAVGLQRMPIQHGKILTLSLLFCAGSLYLFVDWFRVAWLFVK